MKYSYRSIQFLFFSIIAILLTIPVMLFMGIQNLIESYYWVNHTWEVEYKVQRYFSGIKYSESAVRAYMLSNDTTYLDEKKAFEANLPQWTFNLKGLIKDNPEQVKNMARFESLVRQRLYMLDTTVLLYQQGMQPPALQERLASGRILMQETEQLAHHMFDIESKLLQLRENDRDRYVRIVPIYLVALTVILLIVITLIFLSLQNQLKARKEIQLQVEVQNKDLQEQKKALERINEELESFNYIASHDLKEPLRKIRTFGSMIEKQDADQLSERGKYNMNRLMAAAERMQLLLDDLLAYTRLSSAKESYVEVSLENIVAQVQDNLKEWIETSGVHISTGQLPVVSGIPFQMQQLFENLLHNAIKYRRLDVPAEVTIKTCFADAAEPPFPAQKAANGYHCICISDNGIGFDQEYATKVFDLFTRLHNDRTRTGSGVGLTICKKIVENHDGFITVESAVNKGTTFRIYLPA